MARYEGYIKKVSKDMTKAYPSIKDDVAQIMHITVWKNPGKAPALMKRMMYCRGIDFLRSYTNVDKRSVHPVKMLSYEWLLDNGFQPEASASTNIDSLIDSAWLTQMLQGLNNSDRKLMVDYFLNEKTLKEIAKEQGISDSRICQIKRRCLATLQRRHQQDI